MQSILALLDQIRNALPKLPSQPQQPGPRIDAAYLRQLLSKENK